MSQISPTSNTDVMIDGSILWSHSKSQSGQLTNITPFSYKEQGRRQ